MKTGMLKQFKGLPWDGIVLLGCVGVLMASFFYPTNQHMPLSQNHRPQAIQLSLHMPPYPRRSHTDASETSQTSSVNPSPLKARKKSKQRKRAKNKQAILPIALNTATKSQWETLPGIGPTLAQRIVEYRQQHGPFTQVDDLDQVKGIGPKLLEKIRPYMR